MLPTGMHPRGGVLDSPRRAPNLMISTPFSSVVLRYILIFSRLFVDLYMPSIIYRLYPPMSPQLVASHRRNHRSRPRTRVYTRVDQAVFADPSNGQTPPTRPICASEPSLPWTDTHLTKNRILCRQLMVGNGLFLYILKSFLCSFLC